MSLTLATLARDSIGHAIVGGTLGTALGAVAVMNFPSVCVDTHPILTQCYFKVPMAGAFCGAAIGSSIIIISSIAHRIFASHQR